MPLQHTQAEEPAVPFTTAPPQATALDPALAPLAAAAPIQDVPRYDAAAVQQILVLAQEMQTRHRGTLSADEVEALGREVGVEPEFIQRALLQVEAQQATKATQATKKSKTALHRRVRKSRRSSGAPLSRQQWMLMAVPPALYLLFAVLTLEMVAESYPMALLLYLLLPAALALCVGMKGASTGSKRVGRVGVIVGGLFGLAMFLSIVLSSAFHGHAPITFNSEFFVALGVMLVSGVVLGMLGDKIRQITRKDGGMRLRTNSLVKWGD